MGINWGSILAAGVGFAVGGPGGASTGAGIGGGLVNSRKKPKIPDIQWGDEAKANYGMGDAWGQIQSQFPELAKQIQAGDLTVKDMARAVDKMQQGPSATEKARANEQMAAQASGMASQGSIGTPMGNAMMADSYSRIMNPMYDAAQQRAMQGYGSLMGARGQQEQAMQGAAAQQLAAMQANRQAAMSRAEANAGIDQSRAQLEAGQTAGENQMYGGLIKGGLDYMKPQYDVFGRPVQPTGFQGYGLGGVAKGIAAPFAGAYDYMFGGSPSAPAMAPSPYNVANWNSKDTSMVNPTMVFDPDQRRRQWGNIG